MPKQVILAGFVSLNGVDLSSCARSFSLPVAAAEVDLTNFGSGGWTEGAPGLKNATITIDFFGDEASGLVQQTLYPLLVAGTVFAFDLRKDSAARSATNPSYTGNCYLTSLPPISGSVGEAQTVPVTLRVKGPITRAESA